MPINILMPALSPTMETGNLAKWHVKEGDAVKSGDVIAEIETDKATMEVEAVDEGTIAKIVVPEGTADVPVNNVIAILAGEGEDAKAAGSAAPAPAKPEKKAEQPAAKAEAAPAKEAPKAEKPAAPQARRGETRRSRARQDQRRRAHLRLAARRSVSRARTSSTSRKLTGSGPHGRIVQRDIEAALKGGVGEGRAGAAAAAPQPAGAALPQGMTDQQIRALYAEGSYELVPHDSMRKIIARRLVEAKTTIPHFYLTMDCRIDKLLALRADINAAAPMKKTEAGEAPLYKLSVNDLVIKAMAMALKAVPDANVTWTEGGHAEAQARPMSASRSRSPAGSSRRSCGTPTRRRCRRSRTR